MVSPLVCMAALVGAVVMIALHLRFVWLLGRLVDRSGSAPREDSSELIAEYARMITRLNEEVHAREEAVHALRKAETKYRDIFENAFEGIFQTTPDGCYLSANPALARLYGYDTPEQMIASIGDIQHQLYVDNQRRADFAQLLANSDTVANFESEIYRRDRSIIWISENARAVRNADGELLYYEGTVEDITERKRTESMRRQMEEAEAANRTKSEFLAKMSHEIRTPLNGVIGMLDLLSTTSTTTQQERYVKIAKSSADALLRLINDILDFSKIEAGKLELERVEFDLPVLLEDVAEMFVHRAQSKGLELTCRVLADVPRRVLGDSERLRQILSNLVNNAIKFTAEGEIVVRAAALGLDRDGGEPWVRLSVRDSGIGIPEVARSRLFNAFSQVDVSTTRKYGGTGLGLAICKQLAELMGGRMGVDSVDGQGSTFWCELPLEAVPFDQALPIVPDELQRMRVLAVDDTETNLEILREQFQQWGVSLVTTSCATEALESLRKAAREGARFDLAILDQLLPDMSGRDLAETIQRDEHLRGTPLVMLSSLDGVLDPKDARRLGFTGCLTKPIRQSRLFDAIVRVATQLKPDTSVVDGNEASPAPVGGRILVTDDNDINQLVASDILKAAGYECAVASSGREAIDLLQSEPFDVVLMDCEMPEMDGFAATAAIRDWELRAGRARQPIIALTANAVQGDRARCLAAGMDDYVTKPIDRRLLLAAIAALMSQRAVGDVPAPCPVEPEIIAPPTAAGGAALAPAAIDWSELMERTVCDVQFAHKILRMFAKRLPTDVARLAQALTAGDATLTAQLAHALKGSAASVSAAAITPLTASIERLARAGDVSAGQQCLTQLEDEATRCLAAIDELLCENAALA